MKTYTIYTTCAAALLTWGLASCELRDELRGHGLEENEGYAELTFDTKTNGEVVTATTKATMDGTFDEADINPANYTIRVVNTESGAQVKEMTYQALTALNGKVALDEGKYRVEAFNYDGSSVNASARPFFKGTSNFQILPGSTTRVSTSCSLQNIEVGVKLSADFLNSFKDDYTVTVSNGEAGSWIFDKTNIDKKVYLKVPDTAISSLDAVIKATTQVGDRIVTQISITKPADAEGGTQLKGGDSFLITLNPGSEPITRYNLQVSVDLTMNETGATISIPTENIVFNESTGGGEAGDESIVITGLPANYTLAEAQTNAVIKFNVPRGIQNILVTISSNNDRFNSTIAGLGLGGQFDLANPGEQEYVLTHPLDSGEGIGLLDPNDPVKGKTSYQFDVREFMSLLGLYGTGVYNFDITVKDGVEEKSGRMVVTQE